MIPAISFRRAINDPQLLGNALPGDSWSTWRTLLIASLGEPLEPDELRVFQSVTGRTEAPSRRADELWAVVGRRGGKDRAISVLAAYLATCTDWTPVLSLGEVGMVICIGADQRQARIQRDYVEGVFDSSPMLSGLVTNRTEDSVVLSTGISIEVRPASFRRLRGPTAVAVIASETAFWHTDNSSNPDTEILNAARPMLATTGGPLVIITSPHARRGRGLEHLSEALRTAR